MEDGRPGAEFERRKEKATDSADQTKEKGQGVVGLALAARHTVGRL